MNRMDKVNSEIQKIVANTITTKLDNSALDGIITVTKVDTTKDFETSKIYLSMLGVKNKKDAMDTLKRASGFIKREISKNTRFRKMPELEFVYDDSIENGIHMNKLIEEVRKQDEGNDN